MNNERNTMKTLTPPLKWQPIPGFRGYFAFSDGSIRSARARTPRILRPDCRAEDGRKRYTLRRDDGRYVRRYGSYFVLLAFVGPPPVGVEACHNNGDCTNDSPDNLRWDTPVANKADMLRHGTRLRGRDIHTNKLTETDVRDIRKRRDNGEPLKGIALLYGVTEANVCAIAKRKTWRHIQ